MFSTGRRMQFCETAEWNSALPRQFFQAHEANLLHEAFSDASFFSGGEMVRAQHDTAPDSLSPPKRGEGWGEGI